MEIGYAAAVGVPILATQAPSDLTVRQYVKIVPTLSAAVSMISVLPQPSRHGGILIDPHASVERAHYILDRIEAGLTQPPASRSQRSCLPRRGKPPRDHSLTYSVAVTLRE